ncbi:MAG: sigma-70 family RNA polymerase sigma factor [Bacteroidaceae bacterium]|nr:sigma-70 family RNA polymerase sigma factor [Bacteroidaceae bacterium]
MSKNFLIEAYRKLQAQVKRYGLSHAEEDALNDAFMKLWVGKYHPADEGEGEKLLYQSMRRRQISLWRSNRRHPQTSLADAQIAEPPPDDSDARDTYKQIWELIKTQLTPLQQDILKRHDVDDETYSEIADKLGMQEAAVRMQLSRARKKIREIYNKTKK